MLTFPESIKEFITHCKVEKNLSLKTIKAYEIDLRQLNEFLIKRQFKMFVNQLSKVEIRDYLESLSGLKPKSIKRKVATLKVMFNYLEFEDRIPTNPMRKMRIKIKEDKIQLLLKPALNLRNYRMIRSALMQIIGIRLDK